MDALLQGGHEEARVEIAEAVGTLLQSDSLNTNAAALALDVITVLARDIQERVRCAVAKSVKSSSLLPRSLALQLANDLETVALPILSASTVLTDSDLVDIIDKGSFDKQLTIAKREQVGTDVVQALLRVDQAEITGAVIDNEGSEISEAQYHQIIERAPDCDRVQMAIADRIRLPASVAAKLIDIAAEDIFDRLVKSQGVPSFLADQMVDCAREAMLTEQATSQTGDDSLVRFAAQLRTRGKLTESLLLRALLEGYIPFFEAAFAELAGIPIRNARAVMYYGGQDGLRKLFERTMLSDLFYVPLQVGTRFIQRMREEHALDGSPKWPRDLTDKLIQLLVRVDRRFQYGTPEEIVSRFHYDLSNARTAEAV